MSKLTITLSTLFFLFFHSLLSAQVQKGDDIYGKAVYVQSGHAVSMPDANTIAIGTPNIGYGRVRVFDWSGFQWMQKGQDIQGEGPTDLSGSSLSMPDANTIAIGATFNNGNGTSSGHVRILTWNGASWAQKGGDIDGEAAGDGSGWAVSMPDANTVAVTSTYNDDNGVDAGHVRIFSWNGTNWVQKGSDIDGEAAGDYSGYSVSMPDMNTVAIGARENSGNGVDAGHVRIFSWNGASWVQKGLDIDGAAAGDLAGCSVSMPDSSTVAIGSRTSTSNGHVRVFTWSGTNWVQKGLDIEGEGQFGSSVSMPDANTIAIGAEFNDYAGENAGRVRVFSWDGTSWVQKGLDIDGEAAYDFFAWSLSMPDANTVAASAPFNDGNEQDAGHVRIFKLRGVYGNAFLDLNQNCTQNLYELGVGNVVLTINPGNIATQTNSDGTWIVDSLPAGTYTVSADTTDPNWTLSCATSQTFTVLSPDSLTHAGDLGYLSTNACSAPTISIHTPFLRPGFSRQRVFVRACNNIMSLDMIDSAYVEVELNSLLVVDSASLAYTPLGNNKYKVAVGDLYPGQCVNFWLDCTLDTNAVVGQTLCLQAELYPVDSCALDTFPNPFPVGTVSPCTTPWDQSSLVITGKCENDSTICFTIYNTADPGIGDMTCFAPVQLYIDTQFVLLDSVQLNGGDSIQLCYTGDGRTWRMEVGQHPLHPGNSQPNATVERCGNAINWTPGLVNVMYQDDADPIRDIYCGVVTASYDPNDKTGYPLGRDSVMHYIYQNEEIEYRIRFQNTGTDTAFTVVIRDTLPQELDIFSVSSGVSSHAYDFRMYGPRVLEWTFNNILLPDSTTNEPESNGFVKFKVKQQADLPIGTVINNKAGIYFDFNSPIITNTYHHTVDSLVPFSWDGQDTIVGGICDSFSFREMVYTQPGTYFYPIFSPGGDTLITLDVRTLQTDTTIQLSNCDSININGQLYNNSGVYSQSLTNVAGCDSTIILDLTILTPTTETLNESTCDSFMLNGQTFTSSGTYTQNLTNSAGCDSTLTLNLSVENSSSIDSTINWDGSELVVMEAGASYQWLDCDNGNSPIAGATSQSFMPTNNGAYAVQITQGACTVISNCMNITNVSVQAWNAASGIHLFPNPSTGEFTLQLDQAANDLTVELFDLQGRLLRSQHYQQQSQINWAVEQPAGLYLLRVTSELGQANLKLVIQ